MSLEVLRSRQQAVELARRGLAVGSCPAFETRFEILRATVWSMAAGGSKAHVNRVLGAALPLWSLLVECASTSAETLRAELSEALSMLEDAGDLVELSGGYWSPATARFVELPERSEGLLVGGVPTSLLRIERDAVRFHGPHRYLAKAPSEMAGSIPHESLAEWARLPRASLQDWSREVVESLERKRYTPTSADAFEFYLPQRSRFHAPQFFRWFESAGDVTGTLLARRTRLYGVREYRLVDVQVGRIVGACELHDVDVRRLMYAHDLAAKNPVRAWPLSAGSKPEWRFTSELPRAEQRTFAALGTLRVPEGRRFERRWTFERNEDVALEMVRSLGIKLEKPPREEVR